MEFLLDSYAGRSCAVKTWNNFAPATEPVADPATHPGQAADEALREIFAGAEDRVEQVLAQLLARFGGSIADLRDAPAPVDGGAVDGGPDETVREDRPGRAGTAAATLAAMDAGVDVIVSGRLPQDWDGHRRGRPHLLVRGANTPDGQPGYVPVVIKNHQIQESRKSGQRVWTVDVCSLADPRPAAAAPLRDRVIRTGSREGDLMQLGHYWRMLQACGRASAGTALGGVIGTDKLPSGKTAPAGDTAPGPVVTWIDLEEPLVRSFSRSSETGWKMRSALERHDHEHGFRVQVAADASTHEEGRTPIVAPIRIRECDSCPWWEVCRPKLPDDDLSLRIEKAPLDVREITVLRSLGVRTVSDLADADLDELLVAYLPEVVHRKGAEARLRRVARQATMLAHGVALERLETGPITIRGADLEIDLDIESSVDDRVYLWGFLVDDTRTADEPYYVDFSAWTDLDVDGETALAVRAMDWLRQQSENASVVVYHYSSYEVDKINQLAERSGHSSLEWGLGFARRNFVDMYMAVKEHFFGARGLGLKVVASLGAGFTWRDEDPGGLNSMSWFDDAVHLTDRTARARARQRVLEYNQDDVLATWHLRRWMRSLS